MCSHTYFRFAFAALTLFGLCAPIHSATFCVNSTSGISTALATAQSNGEADTINIVSGTYLLNSELQYFGAPDETYGLAIIGGLAPGCASYAASGSTVLDGQNTTRIFTIGAYGEVDIGRITFQHANAAQYFGGAVNLANGSDADMYVFGNQFIANKTVVGAGGALYVSTSTQGDLFLWSNLFIANSGAGAGAIYLYGNHNTYVTGNTILANSLNNHTGLGGLDLTGSGHFWISNNLLWNNEGVDVYDQVGHADYANNDIGALGGFAPLSQSNELNVDPDFNGFLSVIPAPGSPLVNAGLDNPPGAIGCCDAAGTQRRQGNHVDIGAFETDVLFRDGFGT